MGWHGAATGILYRASTVQKALPQGITRVPCEMGSSPHLPDDLPKVTVSSRARVESIRKLETIEMSKNRGND